ncbi:MAG: hypothetical protein AAF711_17795 [Planctomycetota bacterium]
MTVYMFADYPRGPVPNPFGDRCLTPKGQRTIDSLLRRQPEELFDIRDDLRQVRNLCDSPGMSDTLSDLRQQLKTFRQRTCAPWLQTDHQLDRRAEPWTCS